MWKNFFYFNPRERNGILLLLAIIVGIFVGKFFLSSRQSIPKPIEIAQSDSTLHFQNQSDVQPRTHYNRYTGNQPRNFNRIRSGDEKRTYYQSRSQEEAFEKRDSNFRKYPKPEKFATGTVIELNRIDTADLMKIPGIGSSFASRIVKYRQILGGYYSVQQLQEVYGMYVELYEKISPYFKICPDSVHRIPVNKCSLEKLKAHPYINFYQAKAIVEMRKKKGRLKNSDELKLLEEFTEKDLERIQNYLSYD